jgi:hypothetical protein
MQKPRSVPCGPLCYTSLVTHISAALRTLISGAMFAQVTAGGWSELTQRAKAPLSCTLCKSRFSWREFLDAGRACPDCKVPLGQPTWYRVLLAAAGLCVAGYVMYAGYTGPDASGWLIVGLPFALIAAKVTQAVILRLFPPRLDPHAEGSTWLKLSE